MSDSDWDDTTQTNAETPAVVVKQSKLGWVAFAVAFLGLGASVALLWVRTDRETRRANTEAEQRVAAEARAVKAEQAVSAQLLKATELEDQLKKATAERDAAQAEAKAAKDRLTSSEKATPAKPPVKAPVKKKKRR